MSTAGGEPPQPDFLTPPGETNPEEGFMAGPHEVLPWEPERRVSAPLAVARDRELSCIQMDTGHNLVRVTELTLLLESGMETVIDHTGCELSVPLSRERVSALKAALDTRMKLLDRTMPALRQMDVPDQKQAPKFSMKVNLGD